MGVYFWPQESPLTQQQTADAVELGLQQFGYLDQNLLTTRYHDCAVTNIPVAGDTPVEIMIDASTPGAVLASAIGKIQISCSFGVPVEIMTGTSAGAAVRKAVCNLGDGPLLMDCKIAAAQRLYVRSLNATDVTEGVLTLNLMGPG